MQRAYGRGYARSIGVSYFGAADLRAVLEVAEVPPVINQVQFSPFALRRGLLEACQRLGVALEAYSPLGTAAISATGGWPASPSGWDARRPRS
jgi:diketogulonate reductase-like aldo/keto reductase